MPITIGVDMGGTKCLGVALDADGAVVAEHQLPTPADGDGEAVIDALVAVVERCRGAAPSVDAVGIGVPGLVRPDGVLAFAPHLPGVTDLAVADAVAARTGLRVRVENDNTAAAIGEHAAGAGRGAADLLCVGFGTGIGGAFLSGGRPVRGAHGFAGELGHMVVDPGGEPCVCGRIGCWETVASGTALGRAAARSGLGTAELAVAAARGGDREAIAVVARWGGWVATGLADLVMILDPDRIVLAGGVILDAAPVVVPAIATGMHQAMGRAAGHRPEVGLVTASLGVAAAAIGAALAARADRP